MSLPVAGVGGCTELSASPLSQESLRRLPWCTCVSASASQSRAQCCAREFCCKILLVKVFSSRDDEPTPAQSGMLLAASPQLFTPIGFAAAFPCLRATRLGSRHVWPAAGKNPGFSWRISGPR